MVIQSAPNSAAALHAQSQLMRMRGNPAHLAPRQRRGAGAPYTIALTFSHGAPAPGVFTGG